MELGKAHKGYEYQDLLTGYYILQEIINDFDSNFKIDQKEFKGDKFDDLTINRGTQILKKQIKYSDNHRLEKSDLSANGVYNLALDLLYSSWLSHPEKVKIEDIRLCLAWNEPIDDNLLNVLTQEVSNKSFSDFDTIQYKINLDELWKNNKPIKSWKRLGVKSKNIDKALFSDFCKLLIIEVNFPKFSLDFNNPSGLELIILKQTENLGIGIYPNDKTHPIDFILRLLQLIRSHRINQTILTTEHIFNRLNIKRDFGSIKQVFPINLNENISITEIINNFSAYLSKNQRVILKGEPGSGKSWFLNNLIKDLNERDVNVVKHYCYTDLEDELQKDRIKLNVFYGNLISDILEFYPKLKKVKKNKFGSNLSELNELLSNIEEETVVIIDGLDHIERVYEYRNYDDIVRQDIEIINCLENLKLSNKVKLIVASQPIDSLDTLKTFNRYDIPNWELKEVIKLMSKLNLKDIFLDDFSMDLSRYLLEKSSGNPLYLSFLIKEIKEFKSLSKYLLESLPDYSFNLELYYRYLLKRLNTREQTPRVLSGVSFGLTKLELMEITGDGNDVENSLKSLSPVLKHNFSRNGYIIYHESFRRFIINDLKSRKVDVEKNIFSPISEWFEKKGLFRYQKSYRYYLSFLIDGSQYKKISNYITVDFVYNSLINGQPWDLIEKNYNYLANASVKIDDYNKVILVSEINKVMSTTQDTFYELYNNYIEALGELRGYKYVNDYLSFEGISTVDNRLGLQSCYLCSVNDYSPIWELYFDKYFPENEEIAIGDFHLYLRYFIDNKDAKQLVDISGDLKDYPDFLQVFKNEFLKIKDLDFIKKLRQNESILEIIQEENSYNEEINIAEVCSSLLNCTYLHEREIELINQLLAFTNQQHDNKELIEFVINQFENKNWFYNWLIFLIKINILKITSVTDETIITNVFRYLIKDTKPFKGEPRTTDLYQIRNSLFDSYRLGLSLLKEDFNWNPVIDILVELSEETTTHMQKSLGGPLPPDELFNLLKEYSNKNNIDYVISILEKQQEDKSDHHLHSYISEYNFILSQLYSKNKNFGDAEKTFELGVKYSIGYTFRKDITLTELIISLENIKGLGKDFALKAFQKSKILVDSVIEHTDGKETKHYPISWFKCFYQNDLFNASLYLRKELNRIRYDWRLESSLLDLINNLGVKINPIIELFLLRTFVIESSESHLTKCLDIYELTKSDHPTISDSFLSSIYTKSEVDKSSTTGFSNEYIERLNDVLRGRGDVISPYKNPRIKKKSKNSPHIYNQLEIFKSNYNIRKPFSEMEINELQLYLTEEKINKQDINSLCYYFDQFEFLTEDLKKVILSLMNRGGLSLEHNPDYEILFTGNKEASVYYWVCSFVYEKKTWYKELGYVDAFEKAYHLDKDLSMLYLNELIKDKLSLGFNVGVSGNLINAFIKTNQDKSITKGMWQNLYNSISERLPSKSDYNWNDTLENELDMNIEEVFICILFTRFRSYTVERCQNTLAGISYMLYNYPDLMIKPLKWFLKNHDEYLESIQVSIITLLYEFNKVDTNYKNNFKIEIDKIYPKNYFLIDAAIELLYSKNKKTSIIIEGIDLINDEKVSQDEFKFFLNLSSRHHLLFSALPSELINVYKKYKRTYAAIYQEYTELYYSNSNKIFVDNLYYYNHMLDLINKELYEELKVYNEQREIFEDLTIDIRSIISQTNSYTHRPIDLKHPSSMEEVNNTTITNNYNWIRIAHIEKEIFKKSRFDKEQTNFNAYGSVCFEKNHRKELIQLAKLKKMPNEDEKSIIQLDDNTLAYMFIQRNHHFEDLDLIMLNPNLLKALALEMIEFNKGIYAQNESKEIVLKYGSWKSNYIGNGHIIGLKDEIPLLDGAELLLREDYFIKLMEFYNVEPFYKTVVYS